MIARARSEWDDQLDEHRKRIAALAFQMRRADMTCVMKIGKELLAVQAILRKKNDLHLRNRNEPGLRNWAAENCGLSESTTFDYLNVHKRFKDVPASTMERFDLSAAYRLARPTTSQEARDEAVRLADLGGIITNELSITLRDKYGTVPHPQDFSAKRANPRPATTTFTPCKGHSTQFDPTQAVESIRDLIYKIRDSVTKTKWTEIADGLHKLIDRQAAIPGKKESCV